VSVVIVGVIRRKPVLTHASIVCEGMLASVNSVKKLSVKCLLMTCVTNVYNHASKACTPKVNVPRIFGLKVTAPPGSYSWK